MVALLVVTFTATVGPYMKLLDLRADNSNTRKKINKKKRFLIPGANRNSRRQKAAAQTFLSRFWNLFSGESVAVEKTARFIIYESHAEAAA